MLFSELIFLLIAFFCLLTGIFIIIPAVRRIPLREISLIYISILLILFMYIFYILSAFEHDTDSINNSIVWVDRLGYVLGQFALLLIVYTLLISDFKLNYSSVFLVNLMTIIVTSNAIYNGYYSSYSINGKGFMVISFPPIGSILFVTQFLIVFYIGIRRINVVQKIVKAKNLPLLISQRSLIIFGAIGAFTLTLYVLIRFLYPGSLPTHTHSFFIGILFIFFALSIRKDNAFFFITPSSLDAILMIERKSGLSFQGIIYHEENKLLPEELLTGIFSLLDISLTDVLESDSNLEEIIFGDKTTIFSHGEFVTTLMIVSEANFIVKSIGRYLTRRFESMYRDQYLRKSSSMLDKDKYKDFQEVFSYVRKFIPV